jgi:hypothetical protein
MLPDWENSGLGIEAMLSLAQYLKAGWPFRRILGEIPEFNLQFLQSVQNRELVIGVLNDSLYHAGRYWNEYLISFDSLTS